MLHMKDYYYYIDRRIYLNLSKSTQSAAGLKALKPAANGHYLICNSLPYYFHIILYRSTFFLLSAKKKKMEVYIKLFTRSHG